MRPTLAWPARRPAPSQLHAIAVRASPEASARGRTTRSMRSSSVSRGRSTITESPAAVRAAPRRAENRRGPGRARRRPRRHPPAAASAVPVGVLHLEQGSEDRPPVGARARRAPSTARSRSDVQQPATLRRVPARRRPSRLARSAQAGMARRR